MAEIDVEIDELTNSVIHEASGREFPTSIVRWSGLLQRPTTESLDWRFDWTGESSHTKREVVALIIEGMEGAQGLLSTEPADGFIIVHLVESAPHNVGRNKLYRGVAANLFAYACARSLALGFGGFIAFDAKTELIEHYKVSLGAVRVGRSSRMVIEPVPALGLIERYHKENDQWPL